MTLTAISELRRPPGLDTLYQSTLPATGDTRYLDSSVDDMHIRFMSLFYSKRSFIFERNSIRYYQKALARLGAKMGDTSSQ